VSATQAISRVDSHNALPTSREKMILYPHVSTFWIFLNFVAANGFSMDGSYPSIIRHQGDHSTKSAAMRRARRKITIGRVLITALTHKIHRYAPPA